MDFGGSREITLNGRVSPYGLTYARYDLPDTRREIFLAWKEIARNLGLDPIVDGWHREEGDYDRAQSDHACDQSAHRAGMPYKQSQYWQHQCPNHSDVPHIRFGKTTTCFVLVVIVIAQQEGVVVDRAMSLLVYLASLYGQWV